MALRYMLPFLDVLLFRCHPSRRTTSRGPPQFPRTSTNGGAVDLSSWATEIPSLDVDTVLFLLTLLRKQNGMIRDALRIHSDPVQAATRARYLLSPASINVARRYLNAALVLISRDLPSTFRKMRNSLGSKQQPARQATAPAAPVSSPPASAAPSINTNVASSSSGPASAPVPGRKRSSSTLEAPKPAASPAPSFKRPRTSRSNGNSTGRGSPSLSWAGAPNPLPDTPEGVAIPASSKSNTDDSPNVRGCGRGRANAARGRGTRARGVGRGRGRGRGRGSLTSPALLNAVDLPEEPHQRSKESANNKRRPNRAAARDLHLSPEMMAAAAAMPAHTPRKEETVQPDQSTQSTQPSQSTRQALQPAMIDLSDSPVQSSEPPLPPPQDGPELVPDEQPQQVHAAGQDRGGQGGLGIGLDDLPTDLLVAAGTESGEDAFSLAPLDMPMDIYELINMDATTDDVVDHSHAPVIVAPDHQPAAVHASNGQQDTTIATLTPAATPALTLSAGGSSASPTHEHHLVSSTPKTAVTGNGSMGSGNSDDVPSPQQASFGFTSTTLLDQGGGDMGGADPKGLDMLMPSSFDTNDSLFLLDGEENNWASF